MQHRQDALGFGQPFEHGVAEHQVVALGQLTEQVLPGRLDEGRGLAGFGKARPGAVEHGRRRFGQGQLVATLGQPQGHVAQPGADVEDA
ncbi:hypothetical protein D3C76_1554740 [compost metagenome]